MNYIKNKEVELMEDLNNKLLMYKIKRLNLIKDFLIRFFRIKDYKKNTIFGLFSKNINLIDDDKRFVRILNIFLEDFKKYNIDEDYKFKPFIKSALKDTEFKCFINKNCFKIIKKIDF